MLTVACYLWGNAYGIDDVRLLKRMVARHLTVLHDFVCITDRPEAFVGTSIRTAMLDDAAHVPGRIFGKLMTFHPEAGTLIGRRILAMDLDCVVVGDMNPLVERDEPLVLWRNPARQPWVHPTGKAAKRALYNSSMVLIEAGAMPEVWNGFRKEIAGHIDGDQDWVSTVVGPDCPYWDESHGVYRLGRTDTPGSGVDGLLPDNARVVFFPGDKGKPWLPEVMERCPWIAEHRW